MQVIVEVEAMFSPCWEVYKIKSPDFKIINFPKISCVVPSSYHIPWMNIIGTHKYGTNKVILHFEAPIYLSLQVPTSKVSHQNIITRTYGASAKINGRVNFQSITSYNHKNISAKNLKQAELILYKRSMLPTHLMAKSETKQKINGRVNFQSITSYNHKNISAKNLKQAELILYKRSMLPTHLMAKSQTKQKISP